MSCCDVKHPMISKGAFTSCAPGALPGGLTRTRFFDGMVLTQADLENEQRYWRVKRRLTNRALGTGVVWGLRLRWDGRRRRFLLGPGYALDCCGNDLIVECPTEVSESDLTANADPGVGIGPAPIDPRTNRPVGGDPVLGSGFVAARVPAARQIALSHACVVLQYVECPEDARPVHLDPCAPPSSRCEPSRIRETTRLLLVPPPSPPPPDCLDDFHAELEELKASLDPQLRAELFPPAASATAAETPAPSARLPVALRVVTPGSGSNTEHLFDQLPANGSVPSSDIPVIAGARFPSGMRAGLVQFELHASEHWGFYRGEVRDGAAVVGRVVGPIDARLFWDLKVTLPDNEAKVEHPFEYVVDGLGLEELFGDRRRGTATISIRGRVVVSFVENGIETRVEELAIGVRSDVGEELGEGGCLSELIPWGVMADPATGERDASTLLLAAIYAYFAEMTQSTGGTWTPARAVAAEIYKVAWGLLGADWSTSGNEEQKRQLARLLARLFDCWCHAMVYPGPRCTDEHHGVYLGCATLAQGRIVSFDMWQHRRHVLLGPLVNHWLGVFGFAPVDVVGARIAQAICCIAGLPLPDTLQPGPEILRRRGREPTVVPIGRGRLTVGPRAEGGPAGPVREVGRVEMIRRLVAGFLADSGAPLARFRTRLASGAVIELVAPGAADEAAAGGAPVEDAIDGMLRRADQPAAPLARVAARAATAELAREAEPSLPELRGPAGELARSLAAGGMTLAAAIEAGPEGLLAASPAAEPAAVDALVERGEAALAAVASAIAAAARGGGRPGAALRSADLRKSVAAEVKKRLGLTRARLDAALDRAAARLP